MLALFVLANGRTSFATTNILPLVEYWNLRSERWLIFLSSATRVRKPMSRVTPTPSNQISVSGLLLPHLNIWKNDHLGGFPVKLLF